MKSLRMLRIVVEVLLSLLSALLLVACIPGIVGSAPTISLDKPSGGPGTLVTGKVVVLTWHREGGIVGFCDDLVVYATGEAQVASCKSDQQIPNRYLSEDQVELLSHWVDTYKSFVFEQGDQAVADGITVRVTLFGNGQREAADVEKRLIQEFLTTLYGEIKR